MDFFSKKNIRVPRRVAHECITRGANLRCTQIFSNKYCSKILMILLSLVKRFEKIINDMEPYDFKFT
jgi:hypothetical protein